MSCHKVEPPNNGHTKSWDLYNLSSFIEKVVLFSRLLRVDK